MPSGFPVDAPGVDAIKTVVGNLISVMSIISGFMCALSVFVLDIRLNLSKVDHYLVKDRGHVPLDCLFCDSQWNVAIGIICSLALAVSPGFITSQHLLTALFLGFSHSFLLTLCLLHSCT